MPRHVVMTKDQRTQAHSTQAKTTHIIHIRLNLMPPVQLVSLKNWFREVCLISHQTYQLWHHQSFPWDVIRNKGQGMQSKDKLYFDWTLHLQCSHYCSQRLEKWWWFREVCLISHQRYQLHHDVINRWLEMLWGIKANALEAKTTNFWWTLFFIVYTY